MKQDQTDKEFILWCKKVTNFQERKNEE